MSNKAVISLATGLEDPEKVTVAFLVAVGAAETGHPTLMFLTKPGRVDHRRRTAGHGPDVAVDRGRGSHRIQLLTGGEKSRPTRSGTTTSAGGRQPAGGRRP